MYILGIGFFIGVCGGVVWFMSQREIDVLRAGIAGEQASADLIEHLPDSYCAIRSLKITYDGKDSELDMVVVGPTGIFIVETKNHNGSIVADCSAKEWARSKVSGGGNVYESTMSNPVKQVGTHVYRLANYLRTNNIRVYVNALVYMSNPETVVRVVNPHEKIPVFSAYSDGPNAVLRHIQSGSALVPAGQVKRIVDFLMQGSK